MVCKVIHYIRIKEYSGKTLLVMAFFLNIYCGTFQTNPHIEMQVGEQHRKILMLLTKDNYQSEELENTFQAMTEKGDELCNMFYKNIPIQNDKVSDFLGGYIFLKKNKEKWYDNVLHSVVSGCFNFFKMNDMRVYDTFTRISRFYQGEKECYSVGFMQPYFMHNILNCSRMTMLDADWRILYAHYRLLQGFFKNLDYKNDSKHLDELLNSLPVKWVGNFRSKPIQKEKFISMETFCNPEDRQECSDAFLGFQSKVKNLSEVELQLSFLHDAKFEIKKNKLAIVYVSNALDNEYTKKHELLSMLDNFKKTLRSEQKIVIIYKAGGSSLFGIYELQLDQNRALAVKTTCRDDYRWSNAYKKRQKPYSIHLDRMTSTRKAPACNKFLI